METWVSRVAALQSHDIRARRAAERLASLPADRAAAAAELKAAEAALESAKASLKKAEVELKSAELEMASLEERKRKLQTQAGAIKKNDEYKAMLREIESCDASISDAETRQLTIMDAIADRKKAVRSAEEALARERKSHGERLEELAALHAELESLIARLREERPALAKAVPEEALAIYERVAKRHPDPLAEARNGCCGGCHLKLTPQNVNDARKGAIATCANCGRLIHSELE